MTLSLLKTLRFNFVVVVKRIVRYIVWLRQVSKPELWSGERRYQTVGVVCGAGKRKQGSVAMNCGVKICHV